MSTETDPQHIGPVANGSPQPSRQNAAAAGFPASAAALVFGLLVLAGAPAGQTRAGAALRTPWGDPDLQGRWTNATLTPLERAVEFGAKEFLTEAEAIEYRKTALQRLLAQNNLREEAALSGEFEPGVWVEERDIVPTRRTSLIVGSTGRLPTFTPEGQKRAKVWDPFRADAPEDRTLSERCLWHQVGGPPMLPGLGYNSNYEILQTPGHVTILAEQFYSFRAIALDGRPHVSQNIRLWQGDSRGRWDGDTLIVETTNFNNKVEFRGSRENLRLVERFRRVDADTIMYEFTADDPTTWTDSWTAQIPMRKLDGLLYEFTCHEGNRGLVNILKGARAIEADAQK
jgi:hypothetical protein